MQPNKHLWFLPYENYTVQTDLSEEEVLERLRIITRTADSIRFSARKAVILRSNYDYNGEIHGKSFVIWRNIGYRNSFQPIITGSVNQESEKTLIRIRMKLSLLSKILVLLFPGAGILIALIGAYFKTLFSQQPVNYIHYGLIPAAACVFFYLIVLLAFRLEARISKKDLTIILKAETNQ